MTSSVGERSAVPVSVDPGDDLLAVSDDMPTLQLQTGAFTATSHGQLFEDSLFVTYDNTVMIVADGIGSGRARQTAAEITVNSVQRTLAAGRSLHCSVDELRILLKKSLSEANAELVCHSKQNGQRLPGSSIVVAVRTESVVVVKAVGDCRGYLLRGDLLSQLTRDHSLRQFLVSAGQAGPPSAMNSVRPNVLLNHLGRHDFEPNDEFRVLELRKHDRLLLCSHGLAAAISDAELTTGLNQAATASAAAAALGREAIARSQSRCVTCVTMFAQEAATADESVRCDSERST